MKYYYHLNNPYFQNPLVFDGICVAQIGRMFCKSDTVIDPHLHTDLFELTIATGGKGTVTTNGVEIPVEKGDIYLSYPGDFHQICSSETHPLKYDFFSFNSKNPAIRKKFRHI